MPCVCLPYNNEKALDNHFFLFLIFPHKTETVVHILLPLRTSLNKYYYKSIKMESTKMNEALIANHALPTTMNETLIANSALQATGMKDDDGFLSVSIDVLLFHPTSLSSYVCCHCHCHRFRDTRYLFDVAFF
jgi:hypothetical protein